MQNFEGEAFPEASTNARHGNLQKHLNPNPIQRRLLQRFLRRIVALVKTTGAATVLDAGCGEGFTLREVEEAGALPQAKMMGLDFSAAALAWSRANRMTPAPLNLADIHHLPFPDNSFDLVYCLEVLEHLPDSSLGLRELARVSREYVLLSVPHEPFFRGANFLRGKHVRALGNDPEHLHNYSGRAFRRLISAQVDILWHGYSFPWQIALTRKRL
jgi:SAM-dependent methyltransferase